MGNTEQKKDNTTRRLDQKKGEIDFSIIILTWFHTYEVFFKLAKAVLFKFQSLVLKSQENVIHICQWNNLFLFWFEYNRPLYSKDFWKIPIIKISFLLSLSWIRMGSCHCRTFDLVLYELYLLGYYFVFSRYLRSIAYREFTRLVHGYLGKRRIPLPACAYTAIRKAFPTKGDEPLTGFQLDED